MVLGSSVWLGFFGEVVVVVVVLGGGGEILG